MNKINYYKYPSFNINNNLLKTSSKKEIENFLNLIDNVIINSLKTVEFKEN
jgi:hypothetical protein